MVLVLIILNVCHWLADYTRLSTPWMLAAKRIGKPVFPILCHALVHAMIMGVALVFLSAKSALILAFVQAATHFGIDVLKGRVNAWFPKVSNPANVIHWTVFGGDQLLHQLVIIFMSYYATH